MAYVPYSTAWDANHAYMFNPRMRALNNGYFWDEPNMAIGPQFWYMYIAFWFSLFVKTNGIMGISADTIAIQMNFWSGIFVLIFGLGLISEVVTYLATRFGTQRPAVQQTIFLLGWFLLLQWLYSGM
ncbi:MAG: hypothetical protein H6765_09645 [Candidatus Peribacteria bacterium]|nr:MAG: hypothetical protein H6765_09645 [Candidatus Peribacteria bacterium]